MRYALDLAARAWGQTHPNPLVGAVLVGHDNRVLAEGFHARAGELHAERVALQGVSLTPEQARGATLYVTLEPCCTQGRTPPCTEIILAKGIRRVVVGAIDPNPQHCARGIDLLRASGLEVITGVLEVECRTLNPIFHHRMQTGNPLIALKVATTLDGKIATAAGHSQWITGTEARRHVMHWRRYFPAIAVGAGTVLADNPSLTARQQGIPTTCGQRLIFDRSLRTSARLPELQVFNDTWADQTWLITDERHCTADLEPYVSRGVKVFQLPLQAGCFPIQSFRDYCLQEAIHGLYVEGGPSLIRSLFAVRGIDYLFCYQAPKLFGSDAAPGFAGEMSVERPDDAPCILDPNHVVLPPDVLTHGFLQYPVSQ